MNYVATSGFYDAASISYKSLKQSEIIIGAWPASVNPTNERSFNSRHNTLGRGQGLLKSTAATSRWIHKPACKDNPQAGFAIYVPERKGRLFRWHDRLP